MPTPNDVKVQAWLPDVVVEGVRALRRDNLAGASTDEDRQLQLCRIMLWFRHLLVAAVLVVRLAHDGWGRAAALLVLLAASQVLTHAWSVLRPRRATRIPGARSAADGAPDGVILAEAWSLF